MGAQYDEVVIGSSWAWFADHLSKNGYKVIIVEKPSIGGCLQTFKRKVVCNITISAVCSSQILHSFFSYLNLNKDVTLSL